MFARSSVVATAISVLLIAGCEQSRPDPPKPRAADDTADAVARADDGCLKVPAAATATIADSLKGGRSLGASAALEGAGTGQPPTDLTDRVFYVVADITPNPGVATWVFGADAFHGGGGIVIGLDPAARAVSPFGSSVDLEAIGILPSGARVIQRRLIDRLADPARACLSR